MDFICSIIHMFLEVTGETNENSEKKQQSCKSFWIVLHKVSVLLLFVLLEVIWYYKG